MRPRHAILCATLLLGLVAGLAACACGGGNGGTGLDRDTAQTPAYADFLQRLSEQRTAVRFLGARTVQGHWSTADTVAASGCQCATTWAALYVEHRLRLNGHVVLVDEELIPGASGLEAATPPAPAGAPHVYRRQNLVATTSTTDKKTLALLQQLFGASAAQARPAAHAVAPRWASLSIVSDVEPRAGRRDALPVPVPRPKMIGMESAYAAVPASRVRVGVEAVWPKA